MESIESFRESWFKILIEIEHYKSKKPRVLTFSSSMLLIWRVLRIFREEKKISPISGDTIKREHRNHWWKKNVHRNDLFTLLHWEIRLVIIKIIVWKIWLGDFFPNWNQNNVPAPGNQKMNRTAWTGVGLTTSDVA